VTTLLTARPAHGPGPDGSSAGGVPHATRNVALAAMVLIGLDITLIQGVTTGTLAAVVLLPVWWPAARQFVGARVLLVLTALAGLSGLWLAGDAAATHDVTALILRATLLMVLGGFCAIGMILWARTVLPLRAVALACGAGLLARFAFYPPNPVNPWKYGIAYALAVLALGLFAGSRPRWAEVLVLLALGGTSALNDSRSAFATMGLAAVLVVWQLRPTRMSRRSSGMATIALLGTVAVCVYFAVTALIVDGYLGSTTQQRSIQQIDRSGSIILGGRPEWGATVALFQHRPWGYGLGVSANLEDLRVAKSGMANLSYDPNNGYVENYMFGREIKLHAVVADFWSSFGIPGLVLIVTVTGLVIWSLATGVARRSASGVVVYLAVLTLWNLAFGPIVSSMPVLVLTVGLLLIRRDRPPDDTAPAEGLAERHPPAPAAI